VKALHNPAHTFDHLYRFICQEEWIQTATAAVLSNQGARTAGIDGVATGAVIESIGFRAARLSASAARIAA